MKKIVALLALIYSLLALGATAYAGGGKAYIPLMYTMSSWQTRLYLTNISTETIQVDVTYYLEDGSVVQDNGVVNTGNVRCAGSYYDYQEYTSGTEDKSFSVWIESNNTVEINILGNNSRGYGTITWSGCANGYGMLAHERIMATSADSHSVMVNNGLPF